MIREDLTHVYCQVMGKKQVGLFHILSLFTYRTSYSMFVKLSFILIALVIKQTWELDISEIRKKTDSFVNALLQCYDVPGLTLAVVKDDQVGLLVYNISLNMNK